MALPEEHDSLSERVSHDKEFPNILISANSSTSDSDTHAPEVDRSMDAPQVYPLLEGLQRAFDDGLELAPNAGPILAHPDDAYPKEIDIETKETHIRRTFGRKWLLLCILCGILAISVGLGVGLSKQQSSPKASPSLLPLKHGALNDTSLGALLDSHGDRHLFFQNIDDTLQHATFSSSLGEWLPIHSITMERKPRKYTPISALEEQSRDGETGIDVYYVDENNLLTIVELSSLNSVSKSVNTSFLVSASARSLDVALLQSDPIGLSEVLIIYESPTHNVTVLRSTVSMSETGSTSNRAWENISEAFYKPFTEVELNAWIGAPFGVASIPQRARLGDLDGWFFNPGHATDDAVPAFLYWNEANASSLVNNSTVSFVSSNESFAPLGESSPETILALSSGKSDLLGIGASLCAVSNEALSCGTINALPPLGSLNSSFPFGRLTHIFGNNSVSVYHQLNESVLLEESLDYGAVGTNGWASTKSIPIPTD